MCSRKSPIGQLVQIDDRTLLPFEDDRAAEPEHAFGALTRSGSPSLRRAGGALSGGRDGRQHQQAGERRTSNCRGHLLGGQIVTQLTAVARAYVGSMMPRPIMRRQVMLGTKK